MTINFVKSGLLAALLSSGLALQAHSQTTSICQQVTSNISGVATTSCQPVSSTNPLVVTEARGNAWRGSISGATGTLTIPNSSNPTLNSYMTGIQCFRTDAGTSAIFLTINSASTVIGLPNTGGGGGNNANFTTPLVSSAINTAYTVTLSAPITTIYCNAQGYFAP